MQSTESPASVTEPENTGQINSERDEINIYKFHKLTPVRDGEIKIYANALDFVFQEEDLKNIAITGPYSSGKSSMLEIYKLKNKNKKFIHISLAHFENPNNVSSLLEENPSSTGFEIPESNIEGKILNQLIHQINPKDIPQTLFKVKRQFSVCKMVCSATIATVFLALLVFLFNKGSWYNYVDNVNVEILKALYSCTLNDGFVFFAVVSCIVIFLIGLYCVISMQYNKRLFRKLSIQGNDIEIFEDYNDSFFDKHLNEVLYLFRNIHADTIVFEDMDRYNSNVIFEKLREINYLLNNGYQEKNNNHRVYRFFYMLRDDVFVTKDRTKFFDFIIPVVPVIDGANSFNKFLQYFEEGGISNHFDSGFLKEISFYVDDMRLLKNIYNEYLIYYNQIQSTDLKCNKLLSMVIYKNLFPRDFSELQIGKGYVSTLFKSKRKFVNDCIEAIDAEIQEIEQKIENAKNELANNIDELDSIYIDIKLLNNSLSGKSISQYNSITVFIKEIKANDYEAVPNYQKQTVKKVFDDLSKNKEYKERLISIGIKNKKYLNDLSFELQQSKKLRNNLESPHLKEIIETKKELVDEIFSEPYKGNNGFDCKNLDIKESNYFPLIKYLIRNGYISEDYPDYMSYFYDNSIKQKDQIFIRSVLDVDAKPFTYVLENVSLVEQNLDKRRFSQPEVLNFDLFTYLIEIKNEKLDLILQLIKSEKQVDFLSQYWRQNKNNEKFIPMINNSWPEFWDELLSQGGMTKEENKQYLLDTFYYSQNQDIEKMNFRITITNYISKQDDFLVVENPKTTRIVNCLELLGVKFYSIDYEKSHRELFSEIYKQTLYTLNKEMIFLILSHIYNMTENEAFYHKNYSLIKSKCSEPLFCYINDNMENYLDVIFEFCNGIITDNEEDVIFILNDDTISKPKKEKYIENLRTKIGDIGSVGSKDIWPVIFKHEAVLCTIGNIISYYAAVSNRMDDILTIFINAQSEVSNSTNSEIEKKYDEQFIEGFIKAIIANDKLQNDKYHLLLSLILKLNVRSDEFEIIGINDDKFNILVDLDFIKMNESNLLFIRANYSRCLKRYIVKNLDEYVNNVMSRDLFVLSELEELLKEQINITHVEKLLSYTNEPISVKELKVTDEIKSLILSEHYNEKDTLYLVNHYEKETPKIQSILINLWSMETSLIINQGITLPPAVLHKLLKHQSVPHKEMLFLSQLSTLSMEDTVICMNTLNMQAILAVLKEEEQELQITETHRKILEIMKENGWIKSFSETNNKEHFYKVVPENVLVKYFISM